MKHLVTGGSGFLGNLIARHFSALGESVRVLDIWEDPERPAQIEFCKIDVLEREPVRQAMQGIDIVHHTAALVPLTKSGRRFQAVNVTGSQIVAEEAANAGVQCFIHMSSSAIFGAPDCPVTNETSLKPLEIYGKSKLDGELAVRAVAEQKGMKLIVVRPRTIIGEGRLGIFQILFDWIKENANVYVIGDGSNKIQLLHAQDLINAYICVYQAGKPGLYNVGTDRYGTIREALENLSRHANSRSKVKNLPSALTVTTLEVLDRLGLSPLAPWHYLTYGKDFYFDIEPLTALGWKPKYSNDEMLREAYDWFIANYEQLTGASIGSPHRRKVKEQLLSILKIFSKRG
ncbi:MAG: epimerase [Candidatus Melainabacteria bacterium]|nr:MAG: epimerase [Candidatus Melainabacteria bacterium]